MREKSTEPKVLVVEDESISRKLAENIFHHQLHCAVICAQSGEEAVKICTKDDFDLIVMDIGLPGMDGFATMAAIRAQATELKQHTPPVIVLTVHEKGDLTEAMKLHQVESFIRKPLNVTVAKSILQDLGLIA